MLRADVTEERPQYILPPTPAEMLTNTKRRMLIRIRETELDHEEKLELEDFKEYKAKEKEHEKNKKAHEKVRNDYEGKVLHQDGIWQLNQYKDKLEQINEERECLSRELKALLLS